jgi:hypothetical protein
VPGPWATRLVKEGDDKILVNRPICGREQVRATNVIVARVLNDPRTSSSSDRGRVSTIAYIKSKPRPP